MSESRSATGRLPVPPVPVVSASISGAVFTAPVAVARRLVAEGPQSALLDAGVAPLALGSRTPVTVIHVRYHDHPGNVLGAYHEIGLAFTVRLPRGGVVQHIHELPVDGEYTREAGCTLWGFPKWLAAMDGAAGARLDRADLADARYGADARAPRSPALTLELDTRRGVPLPGRLPVRMDCVQVLDGRPVVVRARAGVSGGRFRPIGGAAVMPGVGAVPGGDADRLAGTARALGLDRARALATFAFREFRAEFPGPVPLGVRAGGR